jgi:hypothetical protein
MMDDRDFDGMTRALGRAPTRRQAMRWMLGFVAGSTVGLVAYDARAARRGYGGPGPDNNGEASISVQTEISGQDGVCRLAAYVTGAPPGATVLIVIVGSKPSGTVIDERFSVKANDQGYAVAVTKGTFDGLATCLAQGWFGSTFVHAGPYNLRCY